VARSATLALVVAAVLAAGCGEGSEGEPSGPSGGPAPALGCDEGVGMVSISPETPAPGDTVAIQVENLSEDRVLTYGLANELERAEADEWVAVELPPTPILEIALVVKPGETSGGGGGATQDRLELPEDLAPGEYRLVKTVTSGEPAGGGEIEALTLCAPFALGA